MAKWFFLAVAIFSEVVATSSLKSTEGFTNLIPSVIVLVGYSAAFYFLSLTLNEIPVGIAYAIWSGAGIVGIAIVAMIFHEQNLDCWSDDRNGIDYLRYYRNENIQYYDVRVKWH